jgi:hypothetical protein
MRGYLPPAGPLHHTRDAALNGIGASYNGSLSDQAKALTELQLAAGLWGIEF